VPAAQINLDPSWRDKVGAYLRAPPMQSLGEFLRNEKAAGKKIYPPGSRIFAALDSTPFDKVKVVILGQDPYHGPGQAHGLSFSVPPGVESPPSLVNIFKEIERDLGFAGKAGSHQGKGWEGFTDHVVETLDREKDGLVFMLWGSYAQAKGKIIDARRHCVLRAPHPSPLSAHRGFIGCGHFSAANRWLSGRRLAPIDWNLPAHPVGQL